jgi:hypothetical protein
MPRPGREQRDQTHLLNPLKYQSPYPNWHQPTLARSLSGRPGLQYDYDLDCVHYGRVNELFHGASAHRPVLSRQIQGPATNYLLVKYIAASLILLFNLLV